MIPKKRVEDEKSDDEKRMELLLSILREGKCVEEIKREIFLFRVLAVFTVAFTLGFMLIGLNFDTSKWGYYWTDGFIPAIVYFSVCSLMSIFMAVYHNHKYKLLINEK